MTKPRSLVRGTVGAKPPAPLSSSLLVAALARLGDGVLLVERKPGRKGRRIRYANAAFTAMTGYRAGDLDGGDDGFRHVESTDCARLARWMRTARPGRSLLGEGYLTRKDASHCYAAWSYTAVPGARGRATHVVASFRDMTEKRGLQDQLGHAQRLEAVGRLAGGVAHDFNNLISVINGYCEMLAAQVEAMPQALHEVTEIHNAGRKAAALTRQLLAFGRRQPMDTRVISLNQVVRDNAEILTRLVGTAGVLELDLDPRLAPVRADPAQLQQVLLNLVLNARDALRDRGRITIGTANREVKPGLSRRRGDVAAGRYAVLTVADNGTGMDAETQKHLFEPFFTTKPEGQGTGLGLALVYGVVQQSGGYVSARSELLVGSTFEIMLPESRAPVEASPVPEVIPPLPVTRGHEWVLLVEEDDVLRKMVAGILTADGYRVLDVRNAAEGLVRARAHAKPVQLLITNLAGEGRNLARALHKLQPNLRVLNACNQDARHQLAWLPAGHQHALPKPFALSQLLAAARRLLDA
ncbi:MAG: ATP-binding protein [Opitutales bacterium]